MAQLCDEFHEWVEEEIEKPVKEWREERVEKCKRRRCKKWCLCCNKWFCWIEVVLVAVITFVVITVGKWVIRVVCWTVNIIIDIIAGIISIILMIPIIGRLIKQLWNLIIEIVWRIVGLVGVILDLFGIDIRKKMRICIIILRDENGRELTSPANLQPTIDDAINVWRNSANVKLIVEHIHTVIPTHLRERNLDVECDSGAWTDDVLATGSNYELIANTYCFDGVGRRLLGFAAPIVVFAVRDIKGKRGCSLGLFSDYVTIEARNPGCLAHELGHANYLYWKQHHDDPNNLMFSNCGGTELKKWQKIIMRDSRHITYI